LVDKSIKSKKKLVVLILRGWLEQVARRHAGVTLVVTMKPVEHVAMGMKRRKARVRVYILIETTEPHTAAWSGTVPSIYIL
jgi:hypothetical protein